MLIDRSMTEEVEVVLNNFLLGSGVSVTGTSNKEIARVSSSVATKILHATRARYLAAAQQRHSMTLYSSDDMKNCLTSQFP